MKTYIFFACLTAVFASFHYTRLAKDDSSPYNTCTTVYDACLRTDSRSTCMLYRMDCVMTVNGQLAKKKCQKSDVLNKAACENEKEQGNQRKNDACLMDCGTFGPCDSDCSYNMYQCVIECLIRQ